MHCKKIESENQMPYFLFSILSLQFFNSFFALIARCSCACSPCIVQHCSPYEHPKICIESVCIELVIETTSCPCNGIKPNGVFMRNEKSNASKNLIKIRAGNVYFILALGTMRLVLCSLFTRSKKFSKNL